MCKGLSQEEVNDVETDKSGIEPGYTAKAINMIFRGKSPGHDGLSIEHLQYAGPHISRVLAMFRIIHIMCIRRCYLPEDLM